MNPYRNEFDIIINEKTFVIRPTLADVAVYESEYQAEVCASMKAIQEKDAPNIKSVPLFNFVGYLISRSAHGLSKEEGAEMAYQNFNTIDCFLVILKFTNKGIDAGVKEDNKPVGKRQKSPRK
jgi:hypothetical protein